LKSPITRDRERQARVCTHACMQACDKAPSCSGNKPERTHAHMRTCKHVVGCTGLRTCMACTAFCMHTSSSSLSCRVSATCSRVAAVVVVMVLVEAVPVVVVVSGHAPACAALAHRLAAAAPSSASRASKDTPHLQLGSRRSISRASKDAPSVQPGSS